MLLNKFSRFKQILFWLLLPCIFIFEVVPAYAYTAFDIHRARSGYVLARGLVLENDLPIWAQYNENGKIVGAEYPYASNLGSYALSAHTVNASLEALSQLKSEYGDRLVIMSREQYESATLKTGLKNNVDKFSVNESIKSVVFLEPKTLVSAKQHIILLRARFDLNSVGPTSGNTRSLLLNRSGQLIAQSEYNFAFKSAFYEGDGGAPSTLGNLIGKKAYAPFKGSFVEVMAPYGGMAVAEEDGRWVSTYALVPCPMFFFEYNTPAYMNYYYANFNPKLTSAGFDYQVLPGYDACIGYDALPVSDILSALIKQAIIGIQASISRPSIHQYNFFVDTNILGGQAEIYDPFQNTVVPIGSETKYIYREPEIKANAKPMFYFDGDELAEYILYGDINNEGDFVCKESVDDSKYYGVYLSSNEVKPSANCDDDKAEIQQPDLIRVVDIVTDLQPQGLLESLSEDDLRDTDMFIFRESSGMLLTQRKGRDMRDYLGFFDTYDVINSKFSYQFHMRGPQVLSNYVFREYRGEEGFNLYQSQSHMNPELHRREADHLKPNEMLRIILINRKTGYIGSKLRSFSDIARQNASLQEIYDFADITEMYPPNLKITAERIFEPNKNSIKTGQQKNVISYEGSALSSDSMLVLTTEWFDNDGTPLPAGLADFGYTGRLAKVAGNNSLVTVGGELANFAIKPGRNIVQINLPGGASTNEHFYVNVSGEPISESPSFEEIGAGDGPLAHRPKYYVPFKVPVFNEELTSDLNFKYKKAVEAGEAGDLAKPEPVYHYVYRPEYQFSTYELKVNDILRQTADDNVISLYPKERPLIGSSDDMVTMMYDLLASNSDALEFLGEGQELVFSLGADEIKATIGESGQVRFERLDHIAALDVEDFVTLSLYNNNDPTNVLWDYAFEYLDIGVTTVESSVSDDECYYVSADENEVPMFSIIPGYGNRKNKVTKEVNWAVQGPGSLAHNKLAVDDMGFTSNTLKMPRLASDTPTSVLTYFKDKNEAVRYDYFCTVAGKPSVLNVERDGAVLYRGGYGQETFTLNITDKWGNSVPDGTPVGFVLEGDAIVISEEKITTDGKLEILVAAADGQSAQSSITFNVSGIEPQTFTIEPKDLSIQISGPSTVNVNETFEVEVTVSPSHASIPVAIGSDIAKLKTTDIVTGANGVAKVTFKAAREATSGKVRAMLSYGNTASYDVEVLAPNQIAHVKVPVVVGDAIDEGVVKTVDPWGNSLDIAYRTQTQVTLTGDPGQVVNLGLGTQAHPVERTLVQYNMTSLAAEKAYDQQGVVNALASNVKISSDSPVSLGKSYHFIEDTENSDNPEHSVLTATNTNSLLKQDWTLNLTLKPHGQTQSGEIFNLANAIKLIISDNNQIDFVLTTESGDAVLSNLPITLDNWHFINIQKKGTRLTLTTDNQTVLELINLAKTQFDYSKPNLTIGEGYNGLIAGIRMFEVKSASTKLLSFLNDANDISVTLDSAGQGAATIFSKGNLQSWAFIQNVQLRVNETELHDITVLSKETHKQIAINHALSNTEYAKWIIAQAKAPPSTQGINRNTTYQMLKNTSSQSSTFSFASSFFDSIYNAGVAVTEVDYGFLVDEGFWTGVGKGLKKFADEEIEAFKENANAIAENLIESIENGEFSKQDAAILTMRTATLFPPIRRLIGKNLISPIIRFLERFKGRKVAGYVADVILQRLKPALKGDFEPIFGIMYGLIFIADTMEVLTSDEFSDLQDIALEIMEGVESAADLNGIFSFVKIAAGDYTDNSCKRDVNALDYIEANASLFPAIFNQAHASSLKKEGLKSLAKVIDLGAMFKVFKITRRKMPKVDKDGNPTNFKVSRFMSRIGTFFASIDFIDANGTVKEEFKEIVENLLDENMVLTLMVISNLDEVGALQQFMKNELPLRTGRLPLVSAISLIETKINDEELNAVNLNWSNGIDDKPLEKGKRLKSKVREKYLSIFKKVVPYGTKAKKGKDPDPTNYIVVNKMNGEAFHLIKIASLLAEGKTLAGIESPAKFQFKQLDDFGVKQNLGPKFERRVDVVTGTDGAYQWHEIKSLAYNTANINASKITFNKNFTALDLTRIKNKDAVSDEDTDLTKGAHLTAVRANQFYAKEFFIDRAWASDKVAEIPNKLEWVFLDFKQKMPRVKRHNNKNYVDTNTFEQCGIGGSVKGCQKSAEALTKIQDRLTYGIQKWKSKKDIIAGSILGKLAEDDVEKYMEAVKNIKESFIGSMTASDWIKTTPDFEVTGECKI